MLVMIGMISGCGKPKPETLVSSGYDVQEMDLAIARARREVDSFVLELAKPTGTDHAVKVPIVDGDETEHFWLIDISYENGEFKGEIGNEPGSVNNVKLGQKWTAKKNEISDWMFLKDGKVYGNFTVRPLLKTMSDDQVKAYREKLAEPGSIPK
jgi:uncharacterized protein YegJ (DUF2314 family)